MRYRSGPARVVHSALIAVICAQLVGCATAREATRGTGVALGAVGALAMLVALEPSCNPDEEYCPGDEPYYEEDSLDERAAVLAGGGAAVLVGGALVAASSRPAKKKRAKPAAPLAAAAAPRPPENPRSGALQALIEKRCVPEGGLDLRVPQDPGEPRASLPACEVNDPAAVPSPRAPAQLPPPASEPAR